MSGSPGTRMQAQEMAHYVIDPGSSRFTMRVVAEGVLSVMGHNPTITAHDVSGEAGFIPGTFGQAFLRVTLRPDSFEITSDVNQKDKLDIETKMKQEVLEISRFPEIVFETSSLSVSETGDEGYSVNMTGNLTLHGVTHAHTVSCQATVNNQTIRGFGEFSVRQTDYGIKPVSVAGGMLKVKDDVKCSFDIVARKQA